MAACLPGSGIVVSASCSSPTSRRTYLLPSSSSAFSSCKSYPHPTLSLSVEALSKSHLQVSPCIKLDADEIKSGLRSLVREGRDFSLPCNKRQPLIKATVTEAPPLPLPKQKIRIKLRSYWTPLIEQASKQILDAAKSTNAKFMGPVPLPTKRRIYCVLRSPHVDKDSREHFEIRTHSRLIDIDNPTAQTIDALMQLDIPAGVDVEVKL